MERRVNALVIAAFVASLIATSIMLAASLASGQELPFRGTVDASQLATRAETAAIQAQLDRLSPVKCVIGDKNFDNAPLINAALNKLAGEVILPAGAIYTRSSIVLPSRTGITLRGQGVTIALPPNSFDPVHPLMRGGPATRLIYIGPAGTPAIKVLGCHAKIDGITLQRGDVANPPAPPARDGSVGIQIGGTAGLNTGKLLAPQLSVIGFDCAIATYATSDAESADQNVFGQCWVEHCWTAFRSTNKQSVGNHFQDLTVGGYCDTVFDIQQGGKNLCDALWLNNAALVVKLREPQHNVASFGIGFLCIDNNAAGWRLIDVEKAWGLNFSVRGEIGNRATPAANAVSIRGGNPAHHMIDIRMFDGSTYKPWQWENAN